MTGCTMVLLKLADWAFFDLTTTVDSNEETQNPWVSAGKK